MRRHTLGLVGAFLLGLPAFAGAQVDTTPPRTVHAPEGVVLPAKPPGASIGIETLADRVQPFATIYVTLDDGTVVKGRFAGVTAQSLSVQQHERVQAIRTGSIREVWQRGPNQAKKGAKIGAISAALVAAGFALAANATGGEAAVGGLLFGAPVGALYGALAGACVHPRQVVYVAGTARP